MNSKAIKRQLLAAIAMVLVAALALGSSTYAWFVASGSVTATGMKVQASSEAGLVIRYGNGSWGSSATAGMESAVTLKPTSTVNAQAWYHASAQTAEAYAAKKDTRITIDESNYSSYFLTKEFQIRSWSNDALAQGLYVKSVSVTGAADKTMNTALRVGIRFYANDTVNASLKGQAEQFVIFAPVVIGEGGQGNEPRYSYTVHSSPTDVSGTSVTALASDAGTAENAKLLAGTVPIPGTEADSVRVQVYIWYEGEDTNLYTLNFNDNTLDVTVEFASIYDESNPAPAETQTA